MKSSTLLFIASLFASAILFMGCPYNSNVALGEPKTKISDSFIGTWEKSGGDGEKVEIKRVSNTNVDITKIASGDGTRTLYHGFLTDINGTLFLNVSEDYETISYYFYKVTKEGEFKFTILPVTANIREKFEDPQDLLKFFAANMQNSYFYDTDEETYFKIK
jgi:hypothetical protein